MKERKSRIVFAGGGTGGHLFPALAVADELRSRRPDAEIGFVGSRRGLEVRSVPRAGYPLKTLTLSGMKGTGLSARVRAAGEAAWGVFRCLVWMIARRPGLVIGVGGYASGPAVLAARLLGVKAMVMEQNHFPGATNRWLAPRVSAVCVPSEAARDRLSGVLIVTGNPVRDEFTRVGDPPGRPELSLLVFGGSRGARSINRSMTEALDDLARMDPPPRIVHQTGADGLARVVDAYASYPEGKSDVRAFVEDMAERLADADLVVCRAGATTLAELAAAGRPAILVPYPHATDDHQRKNAEVVQAAGGAVMIEDRDLDGRRLASEVARLASDRERLRRMGRAARGLARTDAAQRIADVAEALLSGRRPGEVPVVS